MKSAACPDAIARITGYSGLIDRVSGMDFYVPGFHAGVDTTRVADPAHPKFGELITAGNVFHAVTPSTRKNTLYFFAMSGMNEEQLDFLAQNRLCEKRAANGPGEGCTPG